MKLGALGLTPSPSRHGQPSRLSSAYPTLSSRSSYRRKVTAAAGVMRGCHVFCSAELSVSGADAGGPRGPALASQLSDDPAFDPADPDRGASPPAAGGTPDGARPQRSRPGARSRAMRPALRSARSSSTARAGLKSFFSKTQRLTEARRNAGLAEKRATCRNGEALVVHLFCNKGVEPC